MKTKIDFRLSIVPDVTGHAFMSTTEIKSISSDGQRVIDLKTI